MFHFVVLLKIQEEGRKVTCFPGHLFKLKIQLGLTPECFGKSFIPQSLQNKCCDSFSRASNLFGDTPQIFLNPNPFRLRHSHRASLHKVPLCLCLCAYQVSVQIDAHKHLFISIKKARVYSQENSWVRLSGFFVCALRGASQHRRGRHPMSRQPPTACRVPEALMSALIRGCQRGGEKEGTKKIHEDGKQRGVGFPFSFMRILCFWTVFTSDSIVRFHSWWRRNKLGKMGGLSAGGQPSACASSFYLLSSILQEDDTIPCQPLTAHCMIKNLHEDYPQYHQAVPHHPYWLSS